MQVDRLTVDFGRIRALDGVSFCLDLNSIVAVQGGNGAGKSTLLWALSGLLLPTSGQIAYFKDPVQIGFLAHQSFLYEDLTVLENMILVARMSGIDEPAARAHALLEQLGIGACAPRRVSELSCGQQQLAAFARAVLISRISRSAASSAGVSGSAALRPQVPMSQTSADACPELLLLDEPFSNLDVVGVDLVCRVIASMRTPNRVILLATHDLSSAQTLATHVLELNGGRSSPVRPLSAHPEPVEG